MKFFSLQGSIIKQVTNPPKKLPASKNGTEHKRILSGVVVLVNFLFVRMSKIERCRNNSLDGNARKFGVLVKIQFHALGPHIV